MIPKTLLLVISLTLALAQSCLQPRVRKPWGELSADEKNLFISGVWELKRNGVYDQFVDVHSTNSQIHSTSSFLPWHRWFLFKFEESLRNLGENYKCVTVPYWDWEKDKGDEDLSPVFGHHFGSKTYTNCVSDGAFSFASGWTTASGSCLQRIKNEEYGFVGESHIIGLILKNENYANFRLAIESAPYASVRHFLGGLSAEDPLFFLHLANIDRLWAIWEDCRDYEKTDLTILKNEDYPFYESTLNNDVLLASLPFFSDSGSSISLFNNKNGNFPTARDLLLIKQNPYSEMNYSYEKDGLVDLIQKLFPDSCHWDWFGSSNEIQKRSIEEEESVEHYGDDDSWNWPSKSSRRYRSSHPSRKSYRSWYRKNVFEPYDYEYDYYSPYQNGFMSGYTRNQYNGNPFQPRISTSFGRSFFSVNNSPYRGGWNFHRDWQPKNSWKSNYGFTPSWYNKNDDDRGDDRNDNQGNNNQGNDYYFPRIKFNPDLSEFTKNSQNDFESPPFQERGMGRGMGRDRDRDRDRDEDGDRERDRDRERGRGRGRGFSDNRLEDAWEKIDSVLPNSDPLVKINLVAIVECLENGRKKHASEEWIRQQHMENQREVFEPICPELKCCKISDIFSSAMVCSSGDVANITCSPDCDWRYDCEARDDDEIKPRDDVQPENPRVKGFALAQNNIDSDLSSDESSAEFRFIPRIFGLVFVVVLMLFV